MNLRIDIETFSGFDLKKVGVYRYVEHPDFAIVLFGCRLGDEPTAVYDWTCISRDELRAVFRWVQDGRGDSPWDCDPTLDLIIPQRVAEALVDDLVEKNAFNAAFERVCLRAYLGIEVPPESWRCSMVKALYCGLPGGLDQVGEVLRLNVKKDPVGRALIKFFCGPCKPTKKNGGRTRNLPSHDPQRWQLFIEYCRKDVDSEAEVDARCSKVSIPDVEWRYWAMHQRMLDAGVKVDRQLIASAIEADAANKQLLTEEAVALTGLDNPNSVEQLKEWLTKELDDQLYMLPGAEIRSLTKKTIPMILERVSHETVERVLELRLELGRASVKKYVAMDRAVCNDGRIRGMQQFYGANRTGRDAGRIVQLQNMMTNKFEDFEDLKLCRDILMSGDADLLAMLYPSISFCLAQLIRTALIPDDGLVLAPVDFSAVEARGLAWAANEKWRLDVFNSHGQIYEASASQMFKVPWSEFQSYIDRKKKHPLRQKGKIAELALGFWGGVNALVTMGALDMGLTIDELQPLVDKFREANPNIKKFTYAMGDAALRCVRTRRPVDVDKGIRFKVENNVLMMRLPSGRELCYVQPRLEEGDFGAEVTYAGQDQKTKQWKRLKGYGGKWVENFDQAHCRDVLFYKMAEMEDEGLYDYVRFHVHDEVVPEIPPNSGIRERIEDVFGREIPWCKGMPLRGDGFETPFYRKEE